MSIHLIAILLIERGQYRKTQEFSYDPRPDLNIGVDLD